MAETAFIWLQCPVKDWKDIGGICLDVNHQLKGRDSWLNTPRSLYPLHHRSQIECLERSFWTNIFTVMSDQKLAINEVDVCFDGCKSGI